MRTQELDALLQHGGEQLVTEARTQTVHFDQLRLDVGRAEEKELQRRVVGVVLIEKLLELFLRFLVAARKRLTGKDEAERAVVAEIDLLLRVHRLNREKLLGAQVFFDKPFVAEALESDDVHFVFLSCC